MPPFSIVFISLFFIPDNYYKPYFPPTVVLLLWGTYHTWNFLADKKNYKKDMDNHS